MHRFAFVILVTIFLTTCANPPNDPLNIPQFQTKKLTKEYDYIAPDGSEIRLLQSLNRGGLAHCTLPPGKISSAVRHKTVEEIWYIIEGVGEVWRKRGEKEQVVTVEPGVSVTIPVGTHFQFRNIGKTSLRFLISTMPPWPGEQEAIKVEGYWRTNFEG